MITLTERRGAESRREWAERMITLIERRKLIDAEDLIEILKERSDEVIGEEYLTYCYIIDLIEEMPDVSHREEVRNRLP